MEVGSSEEIVSALLDGRLDLAVVGYQPQDDALEAQVVFEDQLVAVFAPDYGLARQNKVGVEDLLAQPLLQRTQGSATRQVLERALAERGYDPDDMKIIMELGSSRALLEAAARGLGWRWCPKRLLPTTPTAAAWPGVRRRTGTAAQFLAGSVPAPPFGGPAGLRAILLGVISVAEEIRLTQMVEAAG